MTDAPITADIIYVMQDLPYRSAIPHSPHAGPDLKYAGNIIPMGAKTANIAIKIQSFDMVLII